jgi:transposase
MLEMLRRHYRRAKTITLILDNYIIHKSKQTERWLQKNPKFCLVFQPVYSPWVNHIERLWHKLHETITRNHQCRGMTKPAGPSETLHGYRVSFPEEWLWHSEGVALLGSVI